MRTSQTTRKPHQGLYIMQQLKEVIGLGTATEPVPEINRGLTGKAIHVVGPRRFENELLVSFIGKETGADCFVTDFDSVEGYLVDTVEEPTRLFLIDYREAQLQEILKQSYLEGNGSPLARRIISLFNSGKEKDAGEWKHSKSACGVLFNCDSTTTLLNWMCRLFNGSQQPGKLLGRIHGNRQRDRNRMSTYVEGIATPDAYDRGTQKPGDSGADRDQQPHRSYASL